MRKPGRILLFLSFASVLIVAGTTLFGRDEAPKQPVQDVVTPPGTSGMLVAIDPETGTLTQPSPEQIRELEQLSAASKAQTPRVETFVLDDGTVGAYLDESFDHTMTVHIDADGRRHADCERGETSLCKHDQTTGGKPAALPEE